MSKPTPRNEESPFKFHELFFSTTDKRGVIKDGNSVFVRVSNYPEEQLIGAPHSLIRHPDMPRCVFKVFWSFLNAHKPICAYVKNLAADGRYYWVFAYAFPVEDGYLSIRFKPSSPLFETAKKIYEEVLKKEKETSMDQGLRYLLDILNENGFEEYSDFMVAAAISELQARDAQLQKGESFHLSGNTLMSHISEISEKSNNILDINFAKAPTFIKGSETFKNNLSLLRDEFQKLKFLSVNMNILAVNYGESAATLSVISEEFSKLANQIEAQVKTFTQFTESLTEAISKCSEILAALKTQMNMVDFFVKESISNSEHVKNAFDGMLRSKDMFTDLFKLSISQLDRELARLEVEMLQINEQIIGIKKLVRTLEIIKQTGAIESSRQDDIKSSFNVYLQEMTSFLDLLRQSINEMAQQQTTLTLETKEIRESSDSIKNNVSEIFSMALKSAVHPQIMPSLVKSS